MFGAASLERGDDEADVETHRAGFNARGSPALRVAGRDCASAASESNQSRAGQRRPEQGGQGLAVI